MKSKIVLFLSCLFSIAFILYVFKLTDDINKIEQNLIDSPNVINITDKITTRLWVTDKELPKGWAEADFNDEEWKVIKIPQHRLAQEKALKEGGVVYYRISVPRQELSALLPLKDESFLGLQHILFAKYDIFINGSFYRANSPTNYDEAIINLPLYPERDNVIGIKGYVQAGSTGIDHRGAILAGKGGELNELHRYSYKGMTVLSLIFILCKGSILFVFTLIFLVVNVDKFFEKFLIFGLFVLSEDILTADYLTHLISFNQLVILYNLVNIGAIVFLLLFMGDVLGKTHEKKQVVGFVSILSVLSFGIAFDLLYSGHFFNVDHLLTFWNCVQLAVLTYLLPKVLRVDKVLSLIMLLAIGLTTWTTVVSDNAGHNLKAFGNLLLFFMVAYQTFILFRREQNLLQVKQKQLLEQEKDVAIGKTAGILAHDVRRPLEQMSFILERIMAGENSEEFLKAAKKDVEFSIVSVNNQVNDIMNFSLIKQVNLEPVSFYKVLSGAIKQVMTITRQMDIQLEYDFKAKVLILGDESRLASVLTNLLSNAVEAIRDIGGKQYGKIKLVSELSGSEFVFRIHNDGPQIPLAVMDNIFKPLFTHGKSRGTGLGLASVQKTIYEHQGTITATNCHDGVEFSLKFKAAETPDEISSNDFLSAAEAYCYQRPMKVATDERRSLRIFILDDDSQIYDYFKYLVDHIAFNVELTYANDYLKGKESVCSKRFDLYILDYDIGEGKTGIDFYNEFLHFLSNEVIIHSNRDSSVLANRRCLHHQKPMTADALQAVCEELYADRLKILFVDDSQLTLMAWELFHGRHNIVVADSPEEALNLISNPKERIDLCVLDYYYDNSSLNGESLAQLIRKDHEDMKIIFSSSVAMAIPGFRSISKNHFDVRKVLTT